MKKITIALFAISIFYSCGVSKSGSTSQPSHVPTTEVVETTSDEIEKTIVERPVYHATRTVVTDLIHTKLEVDFNWEQSQMNGRATLTLAPRFYSTDSVILDAQAMEIKSVKLGDKSLNYQYNDAKKLRIHLDKTYDGGEKYELVIEYIAKPEEKEVGGSSAISSDKGLYFINPRGENPNQMPHIWTQGETQANSVWFPTFDSPNFKSTQEIYITVDDKYKTLSNGRLVTSLKNNDGTRTDYWKQDLPHAPYLFMMAIGEFKIVEDSYTKADGTIIPVHYYVEPEWEEHATAIFGETPAMIKFFSEKLGVEYPWDKYHQVVVREYVSGAMENTTASVFGDFVYKTTRETLDAHSESIIAHELFHHWFGDLVTAESWSNLPLNESFANYSQYLWDEYRHGRDEADYNAETEKEGYYQTASMGGHHDMVWYDYEFHEKMFDAHAYNKGGRILHMLRYYVGDEAFFAALKLYLETNQFKAAEMAQLRLAFEEITGEDLNWFFNQWFFAKGHPELKISQEITGNQITLSIEQTQDLDEMPLYKLPTIVGIYANGTKISYPIVIDRSYNEFSFEFEGELENIIIDEDRALLAKVSHKKPREWYLHQFYNAPRYLDRKEAILNGGRLLRTTEGKQLIEDALNDDFWEIRQMAIDRLSRLGNDQTDKIFELVVQRLKEDKHSRVRAFAVNYLADKYLGGEKGAEVRNLLKSTIENDASYLVVSSALSSFLEGNEEDRALAKQYAHSFEDEKSSTMKAQVVNIYAMLGEHAKLDYMNKAILSGDIVGYDMIGALMNYTNFYGSLKVEEQLVNFEVLESLAQKEDAYTKAVFPMNVMTLIRAAESRTFDAGDSDKEKNERYIQKLTALVKMS